MQSILCLDIGSGTQDVLLYYPDRELENCPKYILPSPARMVAQRIDRLSSQKKNIYLYGKNMGGGFFRSLKKHLETGLRAAVHPEAALAINDDPQKVRSLGLEITDNCPGEFSPILLADFETGFWKSMLALSGLDYPDFILACVQDHGFHPHTSNRKGRFEYWEKFLHQDQGQMEKLLFSTPPAAMTRLQSLKDSIGCGMVSDSGAAALLGTLFDSEIEKLTQQRGICVINIGNSHTIAFLVFKGQVWGIYEHHTGIPSPDKLWEQLQRFRLGKLSNQEIFDDWGHGCTTLQLPPQAQEFAPTFVLGPRRNMLQGYDVKFVSPGGDMMLAGCFGLLKGLSALQSGLLFGKQI